MISIAKYHPKFRIHHTINPRMHEMLVALAAAAAAVPPASRRLVLAAATAQPLALSPLRGGRALSLDQAITLVRERGCPAFVAAARSSGRLLYRGEADARPAALLRPAPDLLRLDTYGDRRALRYFQRLERSLASSARPSNGHVGVSRIDEAAVWGAATSVWPICANDELGYVWPEDRSTFWSAAEGGASRLVQDAGLADALRRGHEVLFASTRGSEYVGIAASEDDRVIDALGLLA